MEDITRNHGDPCLHLCAETGSDSVVELKGFILTNRIKVLNVAGSRESKEPGVGDFVKEVLSKALLKGQNPLTTAVCVAPGTARGNFDCLHGRQNA